MPVRPPFCRAARHLPTWVWGLAGLAGVLSTAPRAQACEGTAERVVGYSWQQDEYVVELSTVDAAEPSHYVTRRLSTGEVLDDVTCPDAQPCTATEALGLHACWYRPLPRTGPGDLSVQPVGDGALDSEVRLAGEAGTLPLFRVRGAGTLAVRAAVRVDGHRIVFLTDTVDPEGCNLTRERAVVIADPGPALADGQASAAVPLDREPLQVELVATLAAADARVAAPLSPDGLQPLTMAARAAAAVHLDALAGCWAQEALSIIGRQSARAGRHPMPDVEVEAVRVIVIGSSTQSEP